MKTATVTWITYNNYGTLLQAYALQKYLELLGCGNEILSDAEILREFSANRPKQNKKAPPQQSATAEMSRIKSLLSNPRRLGRVITAHFDSESYIFPYEASQAACEEFKNKELKIREGITGEGLAALNDGYDAFICGSDQVWSVFDSIFNPYYYLDFAAKKKIAYAPSLGTDKIPDATAEKVKTLLNDFAAVSVREQASAEQLKKLTGREVSWVCDPTLLHSREFWSEFAADARVPKRKYLLCYFLENRAWYFEYARKLSKRLGLKIVLIPNKWDYLKNENILQRAVDPRDFVALFENAAYVLTDSYHGSIFSLIFARDFMYLKRFADTDSNSQNIRIESLFGYLGIGDRIANQSPTRIEGLKITDYERISRLLSDFREESGNYLRKALETGND